MEHDAVVKPFTGQLLDPRNMIGCKIRFQFDHHLAMVNLHNQGVFRIIYLSHSILLLARRKQLT